MLFYRQACLQELYLKSMYSVILKRHIITIIHRVSRMYRYIMHRILGPFVNKHGILGSGSSPVS